MRRTAREGRCRRGTWRRLYTHVYLVGGQPPDDRARVLAAVLDAGWHATAGGSTAAFAYGLDRPAGPAHRADHGRPPHRPRSPRRVDPPPPRARAGPMSGSARGIPLTSPPQTLITLAATLGRRRAGSAVRAGLPPAAGLARRPSGHAIDATATAPGLPALRPRARDPALTRSAQRAADARAGPPRRAAGAADEHRGGRQGAGPVLARGEAWASRSMRSRPTARRPRSRTTTSSTPTWRRPTCGSSASRAGGSVNGRRRWRRSWRRSWRFAWAGCRRPAGADAVHQTARFGPGRAWVRTCVLDRAPTHPRCVRELAGRLVRVPVRPPGRAAAPAPAPPTPPCPAAGGRRWTATSPRGSAAGPRRRPRPGARPARPRRGPRPRPGRRR